MSRKKNKINTGEPYAVKVARTVRGRVAGVTFDLSSKALATYPTKLVLQGLKSQQWGNSSHLERLLISWCK